MKGSNWEEEKEESSREGMRQMPKSSFHHESHFIDEFVDLDELLRETLPQVGEAVKLIERQKEADQISSDEAQEGQMMKRIGKTNRKKKPQNEADQILSEGALQGQKKKIMEMENRKKKRKKRVSTPSPSQRNEFESDLKKEHRLEIMGVRVSDNYNGTQEPSAPHHTKASSDEAQDSADKHAKKKRKMGTKDLQRKRSELGFDSGKKRKMGTDLQRKRSELGFDFVSGEDSNEVLAGDNSQTTMSNGNQSKFLTPKEAWELRLQYLVMETGLQMLTFMKDLYIDTMQSLKETIKQTHG